jgi:hypothetical protein
MDALEVVLANEDRTGDYLPATANLGFAQSSGSAPSWCVPTQGRS